MGRGGELIAGLVRAEVWGRVVERVAGGRQSWPGRRQVEVGEDATDDLGAFTGRIRLGWHLIWEKASRFLATIRVVAQ